MRRGMYLMGVLDDSDIEWLASHGTGLLASAGQILVREGQPLDSLFVILDGHLCKAPYGLPITGCRTSSPTSSILKVRNMPRSIGSAFVLPAR